MISLHYHMIYHYQTCLDNTISRTFLAWDFACWILSQGLTLFWKASNIMPKHIYLYEMKFYWAVQ